MSKNTPSVPEEIIEAAKAGRLVVFVGAGVSRLAGSPSWKELALSWLEHLYSHNAIDYYEKEKLQLFDARRLLTLCEIIQQEIPETPKPEMKILIQGSAKPAIWRPIYKALYAFKAIFVTTNYDEFLDEAATAVPPAPNPSEPKESESTTVEITEQKSFYLGSDLLESKLDIGNVLHIHGSLKDPQSMIVTITDYLHHYATGSDAQQFLVKLFKSSYRVLFIGYGLDELEILEFLVRGAAPGKDELQHFMLYRYFEEEERLLEHQRRYYKELGVKLIPYSVSKGGNERLGDILQSWSEQIGPISQPMDFLERRKLLDEVI